MMKNVHIGWAPVGMTKIPIDQHSKLKLNKSKYTGGKQTEFKLIILSNYVETPVWHSSNEEVAIVDQEGNVMLIAEGVAIITVTSGKLTGTCSITVVLSSEEKLEQDLEETGNAVVSDTVNKTVEIAKDAKLELTEQASIVGDVITEPETGMTSSYAIVVLEESVVTISGDGEIRAQEADNSIAVWAKQGTVNIEGGAFYNESSNSSLIYASDGANINISGGEFYPSPATSSYSLRRTVTYCPALDVDNPEVSKIAVTGGVFHNFNPADNSTGINFLADGYESVEIEPGVWEVREIKNVIDPSNIYYGVINNEGVYTSFNDITESMLITGINNGNIKSANVSKTELSIPVAMYDVVIILIPISNYKAYKDNLGTKSPFNEVNTGLNFHANGDIKMGDFYVFGEWFTSVDGANLKVYVE